MRPPGLINSIINSKYLWYALLSASVNEENLNNRMQSWPKIQANLGDKDM
jgi:hypothetical protein